MTTLTYNISIALITFSVVLDTCYVSVYYIYTVVIVYRGLKQCSLTSLNHVIKPIIILCIVKLKLKLLSLAL